MSHKIYQTVEEKKAHRAQQARERRALDPEKQRAYLQARRQADPERFREYSRRAYLKDADKRNAKMKALREADPQKFRDSQYDYNLRTKYGISSEQYVVMWESQERRCKICRVELPLRHKHTHLDHDHATGQVRGILCWRCNSRIGIIEKQGPAGLLADLDYLRWP